jgi:hypothetical protein
MQNQFTAVIVRKIVRVAVSAHRILGSQLACVWVPVLAAALLVSLSGCNGQSILRGLGTQTEQPAQPVQPTPAAKPAKTGQHAKKHDPKPEPTPEDLFQYIRGKLLSLSPGDGFNDNLEVTFDPATSVLTITQPDGRCDIYLNAIDANSVLWETVDPSETYHTRPEILRLTMNSLSGKTARTCYDNKNKIDKNIASNRARLVFSHAKASAVPDFTDKMDKAIKKLVVLSGGAPEKEIF